MDWTIFECADYQHGPINTGTWRKGKLISHDQGYFEHGCTFKISIDIDLTDSNSSRRKYWSWKDQVLEFDPVETEDTDNGGIAGQERSTENNKKTSVHRDLLKLFHSDQH